MSFAETYLKYADLQMAAEALYEFNPLLGGASQPGATASYPSVPQIFLTTGNNRSSKFTSTQAAEFVANGWTVIEHKANTATGFSGTLFRNNQTGEMVLSFRSTEFIDDAARDNQATNSMEISKFGWAFGQIDDMQQWLHTCAAQ